MDNCKIHRIQVRNNEVSVEVQNLLISAGLKWNISKEPRVEHPYGYPITLFIRWKEKEFFCGYDSYAENINVDELRQFLNAEPPKDPALISGVDIPSLIKKGESVQFRSAFSVQGGGEWQDLNLERDEEEFSLGDLINTRFEWRLKPQTIKVELEIPAPYKANIGGRDDASFVLNVGRHQYCYKNEEDYTKTRDALEAVFEAALRGANS